MLGYFNKSNPKISQINNHFTTHICSFHHILKKFLVAGYLSFIFPSYFFLWFFFFLIEFVLLMMLARSYLGFLDSVFEKWILQLEKLKEGRKVRTWRMYACVSYIPYFCSWFFYFSLHITLLVVYLVAQLWEVNEKIESTIESSTLEAFDLE